MAPFFDSFTKGRVATAEQALVFFLSAAAAFYLAFDGGGYDLVVHQSVGFVAWTLLAIGLIVGWLPRTRPSRALLIPALAAAGLVAWMLFAFTWTESDERTLAELARLLDYLGLAALVVCTIERRTFRTAAAGISTGVFAITAIAVASRLFPDLFPDAGNVALLFSPDRLDYPLDYWNAVGAWAAMAAAIGLAWSAHAPHLPFRAAALAVVPLAGACAYLTYSRGAVVGTAIAVIAVIALSRNRWTALVHSLVAAGGVGLAVLVIRSHEQIADATGGAGGGVVAAVIVLGAVLCAATAIASGLLGLDRVRLPRRVALYATAVAAVVAIGGTAVFAGDRLSDAWHEFNTEETVTTGEARLTSVGGNRHNLWASAWASFEEHPLDGTGPGTYEFWWSRDARDPEYVRNAHSLYLESLAETGAVGFLLLMVMLGGSFGTALYVRRRIEEPDDIGASVAMCAAFCVFLVTAGVDWMWQFAALSGVALGGLIVATAAGARVLRPTERGGAIGRPGVRIVLICLAVGAAIAQVPGLLATERIRESQEAARAGDLPRSQQLAEQAVEAMPWGATPYEQLALTEEEQGELGAAERDMHEAIENEPTNWRYPLALARIQAARGEMAKARRTFRSGRRLRPLSPSYSPFSSYGRAVYSEAQLHRIWVNRGDNGP